MRKPTDASVKIMILLGSIVVITSIISMLINAERINRVEEQINFSAPGKYSPPDYASLKATAPPSADIQSVYAPVYSHIFSYQGSPFLLESTLSIRNRDRKKPLYIKTIDYYDSEGKLLRNHLKYTIRLAPLQTIEVLVKARDTLGGSGANFIVEWFSEDPINTPLIETIMIGTAGTQGIAFSAQASPLKH